MESTMKLNPLNSNVDFKKLSEDLKREQYTIKFIGCELCVYNCKECNKHFN